jgi:tRNA threonylcarbamoyladenosine biosynthesis protein TsaB
VSLILCLETATTVCSAALFAGNNLLAMREVNEGFTHAENLHLFIQEILAETNTRPAQLAAIAVSKGPGSYTGLRIGVSTAKGLSYALKIPLISIDTLQMMAMAARTAHGDLKHFAPMIDARRMEVYTALYNEDLELLSPVNALILDSESILQFKDLHSLALFGDGMEKAIPLLSTLTSARLILNIRPSAAAMGVLAHKRFAAKHFEDTAYFEPYYLKEFQAGRKA